MALTRLLGNDARFLFGISGVNPELLVMRFDLVEGVSVPYELSVDLACDDDVKMDDALGKEGFLTVTGDGGDRIVHGVVDRFEHVGNRGRFGLYRARVVPYLRLLSLERDCRIFQNKSVPDIVKEVLQDSGLPADRFDFRLQGSYGPVEYCVQYRETDLDFVSRLLEEEGIFYFFDHSDTKHLLVFADGPVAYKEIAGESGVTYNFSQGMAPKEECIYRFAFSRQVRSGKMTRRDYNFEKPGLDLTKDEQAKVYEKRDVYDYPGRYTEPDRGKQLSKVRLEESMTYYETADGESTCVRLVPGFKFSLTDHERSEYDRDYFLTKLVTRGEQPQSLQEAAGSGSGGFSYSNRFTAIPASVPFRPARVTPKPVVEGVQTATVTGPKGEEIYTDKYGRVKVHFHWDRVGAQDEKSSCWIRVSSTFAGGQYGSIFTPRIGQEVVVDFLEGDPDRPLITGSVYNADQMPPYELPGEKTKSTTKTNSSVGGKGFNEIRFEDKKGEEQLFVHGEKDADIRIKNDRREWVGNDRHLVVARDQVGKVERDRHAEVIRDEVVKVGRDRHVTVTGKEVIAVEGSHTFKVTGTVIEGFSGSCIEVVSNQNYVKAMTVVIEGMAGLTLKVGGNFITINGAGVFISGTLINLNSGGSALEGKGAKAAPPLIPLVAAIAGDAVAGKDNTYDAKPTHKENVEDEEEEEKSWVEIELVDEDGKPVPGERYRVETPDGKIAEGSLDEKGFARINRVKPGNCKVTFPKLDKDAWEKA
ncbi:MAG TPA: type VI secretion system tip protein VgrG [Thermodesulfobacteriota bacterium]|nr:type VI secretion system tip protein VgrG [Thermodesulfobacteriota bacterium]